jgi:DNA-binding XRE family transcriptional regulator
MIRAFEAAPRKKKPATPAAKKTEKPIKRQHLIDLREAADLTQEQVAKRLGCSKSQYNRIEQGRAQLRDQRMSMLASLYNVTIEAIAGAQRVKGVHPLSSMGRAFPVFNIEGGMLLDT